MVDSIPTHILNPDTQAVLLLCGRLGRFENTGIKPLTDGQYNALAEWLRSHDMRPSDLLTGEGMSRVEDAGLALPVEFARLAALLDRGAALALAVESWSNKGLWVISRSDEGYPRRFRAGRLGPPILYGVGSKDLLELGGLAIVGSREVDEAALDFTRSVARACARQGIQVVSGGARGVDTEAMLAALEAGGAAVGVLSDSLIKAAVAGKYRTPLVEGHLALISPYDPGAGFDVGNAMARNKHVYALADWALIVNSSVEKGGTWSGAVEALKSGKTPVLVRVQGSVPEGNRKLLEKAALPFPDEPWDDLAAKLSQLTTADHPDDTVQARMLIEEERAPYSSPGVVGDPSPNHPDTGERSATQQPAAPVTGTAAGPLPESVYAAVLPLILSHLHESHDIRSLAQLLDVRPAQLVDWLDRAVQEGKVARQGRPALYFIAPPQLELGT